MVMQRCIHRNLSPSAIVTNKYNHEMVAIAAINGYADAIMNNETYAAGDNDANS
jgi:hypothetical protein